jgi:hypothetical protein
MGRGGGQSLNISCLANPPPATRRFFSVMTSFADHRETDLFGQPVRPNKGRRGRPALQVTNEGRDMLEMACARGWPNARIAEAVGISVPSLKRHFRSRPVQPPRPRRGRPGARARPRDRSAKLGSGCQLPAPAPRTGRLHRTGSAGQPPAPDPRTGLRSSDRGASFPRQRLGRGGCTGRDRPASRPRQLPGQVCEARIGVPASRASASGEPG